MSNVVEFRPSKKELSPDDELEANIFKLSSRLSVSREEAIEVAKDFYRKYPMLIEYVRSPENLLRDN